MSVYDFTVKDNKGNDVSLSDLKERYESAGILRDLFAERREDFTGHRFITNEGLDYPF